MLSPLLAGLTAAIVGFGGSIAIVLAAAAAVGTTTAERVSWVAALALAIALSTGFLSWRHRMPIVTAWSTPGAALIAATPDLSMATAVGAFIVTAVLLLLTALISPLGRLVERLPLPIASAMLAGVLLKIAIGPFESAATLPRVVVPLILLFLVLRIVVPQFAAIGVLIAGTAAVTAMGLIGPLPAFAPTTLVWVEPRFDLGIALGLGVPLYLVTMASQNLAGFAVLRASGYDQIPATSILTVTGALSLLTAPLGAHTSNLGAISAAVCTGRDCHPDHAKRWISGIAYMASYVMFAVFAPVLVGLFLALPVELLKTIAGLALTGAMAGALASAFNDTTDTFTPGITFVVTASGVTLMGIGAAFWALVAGLLVQEVSNRLKPIK